MADQKDELKAERKLEAQRLEASKISEFDEESRDAATWYPELPLFNEDKDKMDAYIFRFERYASMVKWDESDWAHCLALHLQGSALNVYIQLGRDVSYEMLKECLLMKFHCTEDAYRLKLRSIRPEVGESFHCFGMQMKAYAICWMERAKVEKTFDGLLDLVLREQFLQSVSKELATRLLESNLNSFQEYVACAECFRCAHSDENLACSSKNSTIFAGVGCRVDENRDQNVSQKTRGGRGSYDSSAGYQNYRPDTQTFKRKHQQTRNRNVKTQVTCHICHQPGHFAKGCGSWQKKVNAGNVVYSESQKNERPLLKTEPLKVDTHVVTHAQAKSDYEPLDSVVKDLPINHDELKKLQRADKSLSDCFHDAKMSVSRNSGKVMSSFSVKNGLLYRSFRKGSTSGEQLVVPKSLRSSVLVNAHDTLLSGHCGARRTLARVMTKYFWPGVCREVYDYVRSCQVCHKSPPKESVQNPGSERVVESKVIDGSYACSDHVMRSPGCRVIQDTVQSDGFHIPTSVSRTDELVDQTQFVKSSHKDHFRTMFEPFKSQFSSNPGLIGGSLVDFTAPVLVSGRKSCYDVPMFVWMRCALKWEMSIVS